MANISPEIGTGPGVAPPAPPTNSTINKDQWEKFHQWLINTYGWAEGGVYYSQMGFGNSLFGGDVSLEKAMENEKFNFWYSNGMPTKTDRQT